MNLNSEQLKQLLKNMKRIKLFLLLFSVFYLLGAYLLFHPEILLPQEKAQEVVTPDPAPFIENGIHLESGLIAEGDFQLVVNNCGGCHAHSLVTQNRNDHNGWKEVIVWMQETQGLWDLGQQEEKIISYLATYYAPENAGRRKNLEDIEWYHLK